VAPSDQDNDGVPDSIDTCPTVFNPEQAKVQFVSVPPALIVSHCTAPDIGKATATDVCGVTVTNDAPAKFPIGTTVVTWKAVDPAGQIATATQAVTAILADDKSCCPTGSHIIVGTSRSDTIVGTAGSDCILGLGGNDVIDSRGGNDFVSGGSGNDTIMAGLGDDFVWGGSGVDTIDGSDGNDFIDGGDVVNTCAGGAGTNKIVNCQTSSGCTAACCATKSCRP
jgi:hypothetical protein